MIEKKGAVNLEPAQGEKGNVHCSVKSRSDNTLLTVGFNLRSRIATSSPKSRRDDTLLKLTTKTNYYELR